MALVGRFDSTKDLCQATQIGRANDGVQKAGRISATSCGDGEKEDDWTLNWRDGTQVVKTV